MKVYFIYLHNIDGHSPWMYAFTDKKELKDSFIKERKKDKFIAVKKDITEDEFKKLKKNYSGHILGRRGFETKSSSSSSTKIIVKMTCTQAEEESVYTKEDTCFSVLAKYTDEISRYFNDELILALHKLHYFEAEQYEKQNVIGMRDYFLEGLPPFEITDYSIDYFGVFLMLYGNTLDKKELLS